MDKALPNPVIDQLLSHRSYRRYKPDPLPSGLLERLIECGVRSSSSGNMQTWSVIATSDAALKEQLYLAHSEQEMVKQAPLVLTFCCDIHRMRKWLRLSGALDGFDDLSGFLIGAFDAIIASQSIALAAESEGLGICYMGTTLWSPFEISDILVLPKHVIPVTSIVIGYPDQEIQLRDRLPVKSILHYEKYHDHTDDEISEIYREREVKGWQRYMSLSEPGFAEELQRNGIQNLAQFYTSKFKYHKDYFAESAANYLKAMKEKGFWNF